MAKLILDDIANLQNEASATSKMNENSDRIEAAIENTLSRDGSTPNAMQANIDMNNHRILNLPFPVSDFEPVRVIDADVVAIAEAVEAAEASADAADASADAAAASALAAAASAVAADSSADDAAQSALEAAESAAEATFSDFDTFASAEAATPITAPTYIRTAFFDTNQRKGSGAIFQNNGTTTGDLVITLDDAVTDVGYDIAEPVVRASMLYNINAADAMVWLNPFLQRGFSSVIIDEGTYNIDATTHGHTLAADTNIFFENVTFTGATLAVGATAEYMFNMNTNGHDLEIRGNWTLEGADVAPIGLRIINSTTTSTRLVIHEGLRVQNIKQTQDDGEGAMGIFIGGAYTRPTLIRPYVYNINRVVDGGTPGVIGTHGITIASADVMGTPQWPTMPCVEEPHIERILSEEAFSDANNQDCDCLRIFTHTGTDTGTKFITNGNACYVKGGHYKDFRGRAIKTQSGVTSIVGRVACSINGAVAKGLQNANFDIISIQYGQAFQIDTVDVEFIGSGANDPFQNTIGGCIISCYSPANLSRSIYRGNINNVFVRMFGDTGDGTSGLHTIIQAASFDGTPGTSFGLNVNNIFWDGLVNCFMEVPPIAASNYHTINVNNIQGPVITAIFMAGSTHVDLALLNLNVSNLFNTNPTKPMTRVTGTSDPLDVTILRNDTVFGVT